MITLPTPPPTPPESIFQNPLGGGKLCILCCGHTCTQWCSSGVCRLIAKAVVEGPVIPLRETLSSNWAMGGWAVYSQPPVGAAVSVIRSNYKINLHFFLLLLHLIPLSHLADVKAKPALSVMKDCQCRAQRAPYLTVCVNILCMCMLLWLDVWDYESDEWH